MTRLGSFAGKVGNRGESREEEKRRGVGKGREGRRDVFKNVFLLLYSSILQMEGAYIHLIKG